MRVSTAICSSLSALLNISSALTLVCFAGRDDTDDFFAILFVLSINVHYQQQRQSTRSQFDSAYQLIPLLAVLVDAVFHENIVGIGECKRRT